MTVLLFLLVTSTHAGDLARLRTLYHQACRLSLAVPQGLKLATAMALAHDASDDEVARAFGHLRRRVENAPLSDQVFAKYLFALVSEDGSEHKGEDLFFTYLQRPGNEALARALIADVLEVLKTNLLYGDVTAEALDRRVRFVVDLVRADPAKLGRLWTRAFDELLTGDTVKFTRAIASLTSPESTAALPAESFALVGELDSDVRRTVADLQRQSTPTFAKALRLDRWIRADAGLPGRPYAETICEHLAGMNQVCTRH